MSSTDTDTSGKLFWTVEGDAGFSEQRSQAFTTWSDGRMHTYRFDLAGDSDWTDMISQLRLDPVANGHGGDVAVDYIRLLTLVLFGDVNRDGAVNGLDVDPFVGVLLNGPYKPEADMNEDGEINGLDVEPFVVTLIDGGMQPVPQPSTFLLALIALGVVGGWRKWGPRRCLTRGVPARQHAPESIARAC